MIIVVYNLSVIHHNFLSLFYKASLLARKLLFYAVDLSFSTDKLFFWLLSPFVQGAVFLVSASIAYVSCSSSSFERGLRWCGRLGLALLSEGCLRPGFSAD